MVFGLDDKPIVDIEATPGLPSGISIALNPTQKRKRDETDGSEPSQDTIPVLKTFER